MDADCQNDTSLVLSISFEDLLVADASELPYLDLVGETQHGQGLPQAVVLCYALGCGRG